MCKSRRVLYYSVMILIRRSGTFCRPSNESQAPCRDRLSIQTCSSQAWCDASYGANSQLAGFPITARGSVDARPKRIPKREPVFWVLCTHVFWAYFWTFFFSKWQTTLLPPIVRVFFFSTKCLPKMWLLCTLRHHKPRDHFGNACRRPSGTHSSETVPHSQETRALTFEQTPVGHMSFASWRRCNHTVFGSTAAFGVWSLRWA